MRKMWFFLVIKVCLLFMLIVDWGCIYRLMIVSLFKLN